MSQNQPESQKEVFEFLEDFKTAVYNGQLRLAFENLVPIIDAIIDALSSEEEEVPVEAAAPAPVVVKQEEIIKEVVVEEPQKEAPKTQKKTQEASDK